MPKRNWNDINDSDSSLSSDPDEPIQTPITDKNITTASNNNGNRLKAACDQLSLVKLYKHQRKDVWLYIPNSFYDKADEANQVLQQSEKLKKVLRIKNIGWNVLTDIQNARTFISEGISSPGFFIKFIYSNKNEQKSYDEKGGKLQKKITYVQKANLTPVYKKSQSMVEETSPKQQPYKELNSPTKRLFQDKPKVKWIEKNKHGTIQNQTIQNKIEQNHKQEQVKQVNVREYRSPRSSRHVKEAKSPKRYILKQVKEQKKQIKSLANININQETSEQIHQKIQSISTTSQVKYVEMIKQKMEIEQSEPIEIISDQKREDTVEIQEAQTEDLQKQTKKKKNRKKKTTGNTKVEKQSSNPFSYFENH